jgi:hypothetical protein
VSAIYWLLFAGETAAWLGGGAAGLMVFSARPRSREFVLGSSAASFLLALIAFGMLAFEWIYLAA